MERISAQAFRQALLKKRPKYGNKVGDVGRGTFASKKEALYERDLFFRKKAKDIKDYKIQVMFSLDVNKVHICYYIADFVIQHNDYSQEIIDVKGVKTRDFILKWKLLQAIFGNKYKYTIA